MTGLLRSELRRLSSRRLFRWLGVFLLAGILTVGVVNFFTSSRDPEEARRRASVDVANCERENEGRERLLRDETEDGLGPEGFEFFECPAVEDIAVFYDDAFRYAQSIQEGTRFVATLLLVVAFVVGASFAGAEWGSGSMSTFLTWEPRRLRVLLAKALTVGVVLTVAAILTLGVLALVHLPAGYFRGYMTGVGTVYWGQLLPIWARSGVLAGMLSMVGVGVAIAIRHTAGAVVIGGLYAAIVDPLLAVPVYRGAWRPWTLIHNVPRFQGYAVQVPQEQERFPNAGAFLDTTLEVLPIWRSALLLSVYALAILVISYLVFERRDVT